MPENGREVPLNHIYVCFFMLRSPVCCHMTLFHLEAVKDNGSLGWNFTCRPEHQNSNNTEQTGICKYLQSGTRQFHSLCP